MIELALGLVLAFILISTIRYWLPVVLWLALGLFILFVFLLLSGGA